MRGIVRPPRPSTATIRSWPRQVVAQVRPEIAVTSLPPRSLDRSAAAELARQTPNAPETRSGSAALNSMGHLRGCAVPSSESQPVRRVRQCRSEFAVRIDGYRGRTRCARGGSARKINFRGGASSQLHSVTSERKLPTAWTRRIRSATVIGSPVTVLTAVVGEVRNGSMCRRRSRSVSKAMSGVDDGEVSTGMRQPGGETADRFGSAGSAFAVQAGHQRRTQRCGDIGHPLFEGQRRDGRWSDFTVEDPEMEEDLPGAVDGGAMVFGAPTSAHLANIARVQQVLLVGHRVGGFAGGGSANGDVDHWRYSDPRAGCQDVSRSSWQPAQASRGGPTCLRYGRVWEG